MPASLALKRVDSERSGAIGVGGPPACETEAVSDDMGNGLRVGTAFRETGGFSRMEGSGVFADEGVARDESD